MKNIIGIITKIQMTMVGIIISFFGFLISSEFDLEDWDMHFRYNIQLHSSMHYFNWLFFVICTLAGLSLILSVWDPNNKLLKWVDKNS